jgi:hypothetical protein
MTSNSNNQTKQRDSISAPEVQGSEQKYMLDDDAPLGKRGGYKTFMND